jgi:hypothetical protein
LFANDSERNSDTDFGELIFTKIIFFLNLFMLRKTSGFSKLGYSGLKIVPLTHVYAQLLKLSLIH